MIVENKLTTGKLKMFYLILMSLFGFTMLYYLGVLKSKEADLFTLILLILFALIYLVMLVCRLHYFYITDAQNKFTVRFYTAHPFFRKYKAFEMPLAAFWGYEIKKSLFGIRKDLILSAKSKQGVLRFPAVSISALSKSEISKLEQLLNKYQKNK